MCARLHLPFILLPALLPGPALAAQEAVPTRPRFYAGLTLGSQHTRVRSAATGDSTPLDRTTLSVLGGVEFGPTWGAEMGFHFFGDYPAGSSTDSYGTTNWTRNVNGLSFAGTASLPLGSRVALTGRAGVMFWSSQSRSDSNGWVTVTDGRDPGRSGGTPLLGAGLQVAITRGWVLRLDAETLERVMDARMTRLTGGFAYRF